MKPAERDALEPAHLVGEGQPGRDGTPARHYNYTGDQLKEKLRILEAAGYGPEERKAILRAGIAGRGIDGDYLRAFLDDRSGDDDAQRGGKISRGETRKNRSGSNTDVEQLNKIAKQFKMDDDLREKFGGAVEEAKEKGLPPEWRTDTGDVNWKGLQELARQVASRK